MSWTKVDADVALEVASHEALVRQTYFDSVRVATWCVGMTNATGHTVERYIGKPASLQHCMNVYAWALENYAEHVRKVFAGVPLTKAQFAGILSWTWNLGGPRLGRAAWVRHFKAGNMQAAENSFKTWNKAGGKELPGLVSRRAKEADLIFRGKWSNDGTMTEYTRLTSKRTPVWSSAVKVDVSDELRNAFAQPSTPIIDQAPDPEAPVIEPTMPAEPPTIPTSGLPEGQGMGLIGWAIVAGIIILIGIAIVFAPIFPSSAP
jgi:lysozyme